MIAIQVDTSSAERKLIKVGKALDRRALLKAIGMRQLRWINENFKQSGRLAGGWAPLKENTVAGRRGSSSEILQDTGKLRMSFVERVTGDEEVWVGSPLELADWHHFGTHPYEIRPVSAQALSFVTVEGRVFAKYVHHPGLPARRMLPTPEEAKEMSVSLLIAYVRGRTDGGD